MGLIMAVKIFHCADIHLDTPFSLSPLKAEKRNSELRVAFGNAITYAKDKEVDLFFIAGDLFDGRYVTIETAEWVISEISKLKNCKFFITPGNHDPYIEESPYRLLSWPENVKIFTDKERVEIPELGVDVYGCGFTSNSFTDSPVLGYPTLNEDRINILVCHGDVGMPLSKDGPILLSDIEKSGFDYIALGHIHQSEGVNVVGKTSYAYSGCIEGRGFDELGYKGALFGTVSKGEVSLKGIRLSQKRFEIVRVTMDPFATKLELIETIKKNIKMFGSDTSLRIVIEGEMPEGVIITLSDIDNLPERPHFIEIVDETYPHAELGDIENEMTLRGVFYSMMKEHIENNEEERKVALMALRYGLSALADRNIVDYGTQN